MIPAVFVSRPSVLAPERERVARAWESVMVTAGLRPQRLLRCDYGDDPWTQLDRLVRQVDGVVVLGFRRQGQPTASPWLHVEASLALVAGVPVLAVPERGVLDGVFDPAARSERLCRLPADTSPADGLPGPWVRAVAERFRARSLCLDPA